MIQRPDLKVYPQIGSRYSGPALDRPALRQLPREWRIEKSEDEPDRYGPVVWLFAIMAGVWVMAFFAFCGCVP